MRRNILIVIVLLFLGPGKSFSQAGWVFQSGLQTIELSDIFFTNGDTGWTVGVGLAPSNLGIIGYTTNAGSTWTTQLSWIWATQQPGEINGFSSVCFTDANTGWVDGADGAILHTTNGGTSWVQQASGLTANYFFDLFRVSFVNATTGWAVGASGTILHTTDGGMTWKPQTSGTTNWLYGLCVSDPNTAWIVGQNGTLLHTTDAGATWTSVVSWTNADLDAISFTSATTGTIVGGGDGDPLDPAVIIHTTDGGVTWTNVLQEQTYGLYSLFFLDANNGWAVGSDETITHTTDGGATWHNFQTVYNNDLHGVFFTDTCTGWAVGVGYPGMIIQTTTDGAAPPVPLPLVSVGPIPSAGPGDTTIIPIYLQSTGNPFWFSSYSFHLHLNTDLLTPIGFITDSTLSQNAPSTSFTASTDSDGIDIQCSLNLPLTQLGTNLSTPLIYLKAYVTLTDSVETYVTIDSFAAGAQAPLAPCLTPLPVPPPQSSLFQIELSKCSDSIIFSALSGTLTASFLSVVPNPSYDNTIAVSYRLGMDAPVELDVLNAQGEQMAVAVSDESESKGTHTVQLSTSNFSSGTYFLLLRVANNSYSIAKFQTIH
jgi:hypothetical protein